LDIADFAGKILAPFTWERRRMPLKIATLDNHCTMLSDQVLEDFLRQLRGVVIRENDPAYDNSRRVWNGMIDRYPAMIVCCAETSDVMATVKFARTHNLRVSVRGGGHNVAGKAVCDQGIVIDLGRMNSVEVDPEIPSVRVQAGARLADVDEKTRPLGMAVPVGVVSRTGVAGLTLHGGLGWLLRRDGLTVDNLLAMDVVTADGTLITASATEHPELFWALRGGGGNFGVVTSFEYRLRPVTSQVWFAAVLYPYDLAQKAIAFWRDYMATAPRELSSFCVLRGKPMQAAGQKIPRQPVVAFLACYSGPFEKGEEAIRPLREWATPVADFSGPKDYHLGVQRLFDKDYPPGRCYYWDSLFFDDLDATTINCIAAHAEQCVSSLSSVNIWALGGAMNHIPPSETAFGKRDCNFMVAVEANWEEAEGAPGNIAWAVDLVDALRPASRAGVYLNFPGAAAGKLSLVKGSYDGNFAKLQSIKKRYDPDNMWRGNFNILPECDG
jgi:FAD/FMN-containing dehydrogenase